MEIIKKEIFPHKQLLETLFAHKSHVTNVFNDVLGLHELSHIAVSFVSEQCELLTFSSTPAMEFNLFNKGLWRFDKSYALSWVQQCAQSPWQSLYSPERYDELYYIKQTKHRYPLGLTMAAKMDNQFVIYSFASSKKDPNTQSLFQNETETFYKIGQYCTGLLLPLIANCDEMLYVWQKNIG